MTDENLMYIIKELQFGIQKKIDIAKNVGVDPSMITKIDNGRIKAVFDFYKGDFPIRKKKITQMRDERLVRDYESGMSYEELSKKYGLTISSIYKIINY